MIFEQAATPIMHPLSYLNIIHRNKGGFYSIDNNTVNNTTDAISATTSDTHHQQRILNNLQLQNANMRYQYIFKETFNYLPTQV